MDTCYYVGSIMCGGLLSDGKPWSGVRIALALSDGTKTPTSVKIFKGVNDDNFLDALSRLEPGTFCRVSADLNGKIYQIVPASRD